MKVLQRALQFQALFGEDCGFGSELSDSDTEAGNFLVGQQLLTVIRGNILLHAVSWLVTGI
jgi:hypothetical protein